jgi:pimeloyl-ACP methyl ester carboxylesterase
MPGKMDISRCSTAVWAPGMAPAVGTAPRYCGKAGKARTFTPSRDSSGESRLTSSLVRRFLTMRALRRLRRLLQVSVGTLIVIFLACVFVPEAIDRLGPRSGLPNEGEGLLNEGRQDECLPTGVKGDPENDVTGDPDHTDRPNPGAVRIIRLTNDGLFFNRCELTDALYELNWEKPRPYGLPRRKPDAVDLPRLTVLYVHGWKHSASREDDDRKAFTNLVKDLHKKYENKKQVLGVYVSWNALNDLGAFDHLSFWSKKTVADRISQSGVVTKIVATIGALRRADRDKFDQFIAIGHSFGARILFAATNHALIAEAARAHPGRLVGEYQIMAGSADSVILLNPAFEASIYTALQSFCRRKELFPADQAPLLVSISTNNDEATENLFPLGQKLAMYRSSEVTKTLGNFEAYRSHSLRRDDKGVCLPEAPLTESFAANGLCLERLPDVVDPDPSKTNRFCPKNPFLVADTTKDIIDGHNGIWDEEKPFREWLFALITALEASHQKLIKSRAATFSNK